jgi:hypothetical protein
MISLLLEGSDELQRRLGSARQQLSRRMRAAVIRAALVHQRDVQQKGLRQGRMAGGPRGGRVPVPPPHYPHVFTRRGGAGLRGNITYRDEERSGEWRAIVGGRLFQPGGYGRHLELGTRHIRAREILGRSRQRVSGEINRIVAEGMRTSLGDLL